jgi:hypothetical protein
MGSFSALPLMFGLPEWWDGSMFDVSLRPAALGWLYHLCIGLFVRRLKCWFTRGVWCYRAGRRWAGPLPC